MHLTFSCLLQPTLVSQLNGTQGSFGTALINDLTWNGLHEYLVHTIADNGGITTRDKLLQHDPRLAVIMSEVFGDGQWRYFQAARALEIAVLETTPLETAQVLLNHIDQGETKKRCADRG